MALSIWNGDPSTAEGYLLLGTQTRFVRFDTHLTRKQRKKRSKSLEQMDEDNSGQLDKRNELT